MKYVLMLAMTFALGSCLSQSDGYSPLAPSHNGGIPDCRQVGSAYMPRTFPCGSTIRVRARGATPTEEAALREALSNWTVVFSTEPYGLPTIDVDNVDGDEYDIAVGFEGASGQGYCGWDFGDSVAIKRSGTAGLCSSDHPAWADLVGILMHELGATLGFRSNFPGQYTTACVMENVDNQPNVLQPLTKTPCTYEYQIAFSAYGLRQTQPDLNAVLLTGDNITLQPSLSELTLGEPVTLTAAPLVNLEDWTVSTNASLSDITATSATLVVNDIGPFTVTARVQEASNVTWPQPTVSTAGTIVGALHRIAVSPDPWSFTGLGQTKSFSAAGFDSLDQPVGIPSITWSTGNPNVVTMTTPNGTARSVGWGSTVVTATSGTVSGEADVFVPAPSLDSAKILGAFRLGGGTSNIIRAPQNCEWQATIFGGAQPFHFAWQRRKGTIWLPVGEDAQWFTYDVLGAFQLRVIVTDATGQSATSPAVSITTSPDGITCLH